MLPRSVNCRERDTPIWRIEMPVKDSRSGPMRLCPGCGQSFYLPPSRTNVYCSRGCRIAHPPVITVNPDGDSASIPLHARNGDIRGYALIDAADIPLAQPYRWHMHPTGYVCHFTRGEGGSRRTLRLHRLILDLDDGDTREGDHIDRDRLNNRRANLRIATRLMNMQNKPSYRGSSSVYRGVSWSVRERKWKAAVRVNGTKIRLGTFAVEADAADAARSARQRLMPYATD